MNVELVESNGNSSLRHNTQTVFQDIFVVLGMHRSGTSLCSSVLSLLGVDMAEERGESRGNDLGHWERLDIVELNDEILNLFNRSYLSALHDYPLAPAWWIEPSLRPILNRAKAIVAKKLNVTDHFGFKDPRTCKLLPAWKRIFSELRLNPKFIVCIRNPAHVAASLNTRDHIEVDVGEYRWLDYTTDAIRYTQEFDRIFVNYEDWIADAPGTAERLRRFVDIEMSYDLRDFQIALESIVRPDQNHEGGNSKTAANPLIRNFYNHVHQAGNSLDDDHHVRKFIDQFIAFKQLIYSFSNGVKKIIGEAESSKATMREALLSANIDISTNAAEIVRLRSDVERQDEFERAWRGAEERYAAAEFARVEAVHRLAAVDADIAASKEQGAQRSNAWEAEAEVARKLTENEVVQFKAELRRAELEHARIYAEMEARALSAEQARVRAVERLNAACLEIEHLRRTVAELSVEAS